jgi:hypothetical protein
VSYNKTHTVEYVQALEARNRRLEAELAATQDGLAEALNMGSRDIRIARGICAFVAYFRAVDAHEEKRRALELTHDIEVIDQKRALMDVIVEMRKAVAVYRGDPGAPALADAKQDVDTALQVIDIVIAKWIADNRSMNDRAAQVQAATAGQAARFFEQYRRMAKCVKTYDHLTFSRGVGWKAHWLIPANDLLAYWPTSKGYKVENEFLVDSKGRNVTLYGHKLKAGADFPTKMSAAGPASAAEAITQSFGSLLGGARDPRMQNPNTRMTTWSLQVSDSYGCEIGIYCDQPTEMHTRVAMNKGLLETFNRTLRSHANNRALTEAQLPALTVDLNRDLHTYERAMGLLTVAKAEVRMEPDGQVTIDIVPAVFR